MMNFPPLLLALPLVWIKDRLFLILSIEITRLHSGTSMPSEQASVVTRTWRTDETVGNKTNTTGENILHETVGNAKLPYYLKVKTDIANHEISVWSV